MFNNQISSEMLLVYLARACEEYEEYKQQATAEQFFSVNAWLSSKREILTKMEQIFNNIVSLLNTWKNTNQQQVNYNNVATITQANEITSAPWQARKDELKTLAVHAEPILNQASIITTQPFKTHRNLVELVNNILLQYNELQEKINKGIETENKGDLHLWHEGDNIYPVKSHNVMDEMYSTHQIEANIQELTEYLKQNGTDEQYQIANQKLNTINNNLAQLKQKKAELIMNLDIRMKNSDVYTTKVDPQYITPLELAPIERMTAPELTQPTPSVNEELLADLTQACEQYEAYKQQIAEAKFVYDQDWLASAAREVLHHQIEPVYNNIVSLLNTWKNTNQQQANYSDPAIIAQANEITSAPWQVRRNELEALVSIALPQQPSPVMPIATEAPPESAKLLTQPTPSVARTWSETTKSPSLLITPSVHEELLADLTQACEQYEACEHQIAKIILSTPAATDCQKLIQEPLNQMAQAYDKIVLLLDTWKNTDQQQINHNDDDIITRANKITSVPWQARKNNQEALVSIAFKKPADIAAEKWSERFSLHLPKKQNTRPLTRRVEAYENGLKKLQQASLNNNPTQYQELLEQQQKHMNAIKGAIEESLQSQLDQQKMLILNTLEAEINKRLSAIKQNNPETWLLQFGLELSSENKKQAVEQTEANPYAAPENDQAFTELVNEYNNGLLELKYASFDNPEQLQKLLLKQQTHIRNLISAFVNKTQEQLDKINRLDAKINERLLEMKNVAKQNIAPTHSNVISKQLQQKKQQEAIAVTTDTRQAFGDYQNTQKSAAEANQETERGRFLFRQ